MQLAKSMLKSSKWNVTKTAFSILVLSISFTAMGQSNSPYSRFGLGDIVPATNVTTRGMGGLSAGYADVISVNFSNPASYSQFQAFKEQRSKKISSGRVILDLGVNVDTRTLIKPNTPNKFTSSDAVFSYLQVGVPLRKNWGLSFGIRPVNRIGYLINQQGILRDAGTGNVIDSLAVTEFEGTGGSFLPTIGTGFAIHKFSAGFNVGYFFGRRETNTRRTIFNDSIAYAASNHSTKTSFNDIFFNAGIQYIDTLSKGKTQLTIIRFGISGNWQQKLKASQDILRQTFTRSTIGEILQIDSVYAQNGTKGTIVYPASYKAGFMIQNTKEDGRGWLFGLDYTQTQWSNYRFYGQSDSVQNNWQINAGGQITPKPGSNFFSRVSYRFGVFAGPDYIKVQKSLPQFGASFGLGLPVRQSRLSPSQFSMVNVGFEYSKRGNNNNLLKENMFRVSLGLNLTDLWFGKRKYD
jgi:hypothetical protein